VALGLGRSPEADAASLLAAAYALEADVVARRALVRALSQRREHLRIALLLTARDLDPDAEVRALARTALAGRPLSLRLPPAGAALAWIHLRSNSADGRDGAARAARLLRDDGVALPVVAAPDGVLMVPGLSATGLTDLQLAPALHTEQP
jgi:hypothetical protein